MAAAANPTELPPPAGLDYPCDQRRRSPIPGFVRSCGFAGRLIDGPGALWGRAWIRLDWCFIARTCQALLVSRLVQVSVPAVFVALAAALALSVGAAPASAAGPQLIGQIASSNEPEGRCSCTRFERTSSGPPSSSYAFPFSGVLTKFRMRIGEKTEPTDWVQARTFRTPGPSTASVISEGSEHLIDGLPLAQPSTFFDRIPATAGDLLGARFAINAFIEETPEVFATSSVEDAVSNGTVTPNPLLGSSFTTEATTKKRVNIQAVLEPDEDGDAYGDTSQDLCPASPIATSACSGTLLGSDLQGGRSTPPLGCGGGGCMRIQKTVGGVSTAAPFDGVVVRWRVLDGDAGDYRARVVAPNPAAGGGEFSAYSVLHSSTIGSVTAPAQPLFSQISTFQTRLPIPAGAYVGLTVPSLRDQGFQVSGGSATYTQTNDGADGITVTGLTHNGTFLYDADIEPDADHDGYGDITQDACPTDASTQGTCSPAGGGGSRSSMPSIADFHATPKAFRVKAGGAVVSQHAVHAGTTLRLTLSEVATVAFTVTASRSCKHLKGGGRCAHHRATSAFKRQLGKGRNAILYSGRYGKPGKKPQSLKPGAYLVTAVATNAAGDAGPPAQTSFRVVP